MAISYIDAALEELATVIHTALDTEYGAGSVVVRKGWPGEDDDWPATPGFVIVHGDESGVTGQAPGQYSAVSASGTTTVRYKVGGWELTGSIDIFAEQQDQLRELLPDVHNALSNVPHSGGITLTLTDYHGARAKVRYAPGERIRASAMIGDVRDTVGFVITGPKIVTRDYATTTRFDLVVSGLGATETTTVTE